MLVLPRPLAGGALAVVVVGRLADGNHRAARRVTRMPRHVDGGDCLPGGSSSNTGRGVGCVAGCGMSSDGGRAGLADAHLATHPRPRGLHGLARSVIAGMTRLEEGQHALGAVAGPLGQELAVSPTPSGAHAIKYVAACLAYSAAHGQADLGGRLPDDEPEREQFAPTTGSDEQRPGWVWSTGPAAGHRRKPIGCRAGALAGWDHCSAQVDLRCGLPEGFVVDSRVLSFCDRWNATHPWEHNAHYHRWVLRQLPAAPEQVLDVGCGTGDLVRRLAARGSRVHGVDQDGAVIQRARQLSSDTTRISYSVGDVMALPLSGDYDAITCLAVLHHLPFSAALRRLREQLAAGGTLVVIGLYREKTRSDRLLNLAAIPANLALGWLHARRRHGQFAQTRAPTTMTAPTKPADMTLSEIRVQAAHELPGAHVRRHLFWRYSLVYRDMTAPKIS